MTRALVAASLLAACSKAEPTPTVLSPAEVAASVEQSRYDADLVALAVERPPGSAGWQAAQDRCASRLTELGFEVQLHNYRTGVNVIGKLPGTSDTPRTVLLSAHYDHLTGCIGADDNATGVAGLLEAARVLSAGTWKHDLIVACWDEEESGLVGSNRWVRQEADGIDFAATVSFEMIGYTNDAPDSQSLPFGFEFLFADAVAEISANDNRGDFLAVVHDTGMQPFVDAMKQHAGSDLRIIALPLTTAQATDPMLGDLQRSDHASFWDAGHTSAMLTDTANFRYDAYHCDAGPDIIDNLDPAFATATVRAAAAAAAATLQPGG